MEVRKATSADIKSLTRHLQNKHIPYNTVSMMKTDVYDGNLFILTNGSTILASCAIVPTNFPWLGVKRLVVYNKKSHGKGYAQILLNAITTGPHAYCITPWEDNHTMRHIAEKAGFSFQYKFNDFWCCYLKNNS